jgi:hypothetical protein
MGAWHERAYEGHRSALERRDVFLSKPTLRFNQGLSI